MTNTRTVTRSRTFRGATAAALLGAAALVLTACSGSASVADTSWGTLDTRGEPAMTFTADGKAFGTDGCNIVNGTWTEEKGKITFGPLASTMMFCEGVDTWLTGASTAVVEGDKISFSDEEGKKIGSLKKTEFTAPE